MSEANAEGQQDDSICKGVFFSSSLEHLPDSGPWGPKGVGSFKLSSDLCTHKCVHLPTYINTQKQFLSRIYLPKWSRKCFSFLDKLENLKRFSKRRFQAASLVTALFSCDSQAVSLAQGNSAWCCIFALWLFRTAPAAV